MLVQRLPNNSVSSAHNNHWITGWTWHYPQSGFWFHAGLLVQLQHYTYVGSIHFPRSAQELENPFTKTVGKWFCRISLRYPWPYSPSPCPGHAISALALCSITLVALCHSSQSCQKWEWVEGGLSMVCTQHFRSSWTAIHWLTQNPNCVKVTTSGHIQPDSYSTALEFRSPAHRNWLCTKLAHCLCNN